GRRVRADACQRLVLIPNWGDVDEIHPQPAATNTLLATLNLNKAFVVQFAGNMGRTHDLEILVNAASRLSDDSGVGFLLIGTGSKNAYVRRAVSERGLTNVRVLGYQPRAHLPP